MKHIKDVMREGVWNPGELGYSVRKYSKQHISDNIRIHVLFGLSNLIRWSLLKIPVLADKLEEFVREQN